MKKRLLALILCLVMVIGLVPTAFAALTFNIVLNHYTPEIMTSQRTITKDNYAATEDKIIANNYLPEATSAEMTHEGWVFDGWYYDFELTKKVGSDDVLNKDLTSDTIYLWAKWNKVEDDAPVTPATYKIVLHTGVVTMDTEIDATVNVAYPLPNLSRTGYTLKGWSATEGGSIEWEPGDCVLLREAPDSGKFHVYAIWEENTVVAKDIKVFYHRMNGSLEFTVETHKDNERFQLEAYTDLADATHRWTLPEGKKVDYWQDANGNKYRVGTWITVGAVTNDEFHLYPVFEDAPATKYTVTFYCWKHQDKSEDIPLARNTKIVIDPNGGKFLFDDGKYYTETKSFNLTSNYKIANAKRTGYTFYGWKATEDTRTNTVTFTAQWSKDYPNYREYSVYYYDYDDGKYEYAYFDYGDTLIFDANGGSAKLNGTKFTGTKTVSIAQSYTLSDAERAGYTFYGWDLVASTGSKYYFTAMWAKKTGTVPYMLNGTDHFAYIKGYPDGTIRPEATITRAEVATIFYRLLTDTVRKSYGTSYNTFKDVASNAWYNTAVSTMANLGIITGDTNGYFRPNDSITRAELAAMIARCDGGYYTGSGYYFSDTKGHWAADYIARAYDLGWINGYGDNYAPDRKITRAETMAVLNRVLDRAPQYTSDLLSGMNTFSDNLKTSAWYYLDVQEATNSHTYTRKTNDYEYWNKLVANPSWY